MEKHPIRDVLRRERIPPLSFNDDNGGIRRSNSTMIGAANVPFEDTVRTSGIFFIETHFSQGVSVE